MQRFTTAHATGTIEVQATGAVIVSGRNTLFTGPQNITWLAAAPATRSSSWSGSGMPYPNRSIAMDNSPHQGTVVSPDGSFVIRLDAMPNAFYTGLGSVYVPPHVRIDFEVGATRARTYIQLSDGIPFRTLTYAPPPMTAPKRDVMFYSGRELLTVRSAEEILRASAYPTNEAAAGTATYPLNFWGSVPPQ